MIAHVERFAGGRDDSSLDFTKPLPRVLRVEYLTYAIAALLAYLLGSVPTGYLVGRARGVDIRQTGSGNIGATNVLRVLGKPAGIAVLIVDSLKGALACWLIPYVIRQTSFGAGSCKECLELVAAIGVILGHNYTCWLNFKGGKGIATTGGVLLALIPAGCGLAVSVWAITLVITRYVSIASIMAAISLPFVVWLTGGSRALIILVAVLGALAIFKHKANIKRLLDGTEPRFRAAKSNSAEKSKV